MMLNIYSISDIHLGHKSVPVEHIIDGLNKALPDDNSMATIDIIFICGDVFDEGLALPENAVGHIQLWMVRLLKLCVRYDIQLRVLEGTKSHDRGQCYQFPLLNNSLNIGCDLRYVDTLSIEFNERFGISILYIPDEWRGDNEITKEEVKQLLLEHQIDHVDFGVFHGAFPFQLPNVVHVAVHDTDYYLRIVRKYIFIGHIHNMAIHERILAQGSFDRLAHGEEHNKGFFHVLVDLQNDLNDKIVFKINHHSARFKTIDIVGLDKERAETVIKAAVQYCLKNNDDCIIPSYIRIIRERDTEHGDIINAYKKGFPLIKWSHKPIKAISTTHSIQPAVYTPTPINDNTILSLIKSRLEASGIDELLINRTVNILNKIKAEEQWRRTPRR